MIKIFSLILSSSLLLGLAHANLIERRTSDVTILEAWITDSIGEETSSRDGFNRELCNRSDCTNAVEIKTGVPLLNTFQYLDYHKTCEMVEIRTVILEEAFLSPTFKGIGLYLVNTDCGVRSRYDQGNNGFVPKSKMLIVGKTTLRDGRSAFIHRFHAQGLCSGTIDHTFNFENRHGLEFRPYARFDNEGDEFRNWDYVPSDYRLGCVANDSNNDPLLINSFNRRDELIFR